VGFPHYVTLWGGRIHPHILFETLAYPVAFRVYLRLRRRFGDPITTPLRWAVVAAAVGGAALGSKVLFWLEDPRLTWQNLHDPAYLMGGKTIVGALVFGLIAVEWMKRYIGLTQSTGDLYAIPLTLGIAIGRVGCFLTGLTDNTYGVATGLPWGVDFGDGVRRHPTQIYEIVFLLGMVPVLYQILRAMTRRGSRGLDRLHAGDAFKFFMVAYLMFRLLCDFIKPYTRVFLGLGTIQWACVLCLLYYSPDIVRWMGWAALADKTGETEFRKPPP
jgi:phosphatidylglycerol---prolipoprotein diacylglyceryl transferase